MSTNSPSRRPAWTFQIVAGLVLAFSTGGVAGVGAVLRATVLDPLPFPQAAELVALRTGFSVSEDDMPTAGFQSMGRHRLRPALVQSGGVSRLARTTAVKDGFFETLGVPAARGRTLLRSDGRLPVAVLTTSLANKMGVGVGGKVLLADVAYTVVGTIEPRLAFPPGSEAWVPADTVLPGFFGGSIFFSEIARLAPGLTPDAGTSALASAAAASGHKMREGDGAIGLASMLRRGLDARIQTVGMVCLALYGIGVSALCHLFLARLLARTPELRTRSALGARSRDLTKLLALDAGGAAAIASIGSVMMAWGVATTLRSLLLPEVDAVFGAVITGFDLAATIGVTFATALACALGVSLIYMGKVTSWGGGSVAWSRRGSVAAGLLVAQGLASSALFVAALLLTGSLFRLISKDSGVSLSDDVLTFRLDLPAAGHSERGWQPLRDSLLEVPGVISAGASRQIPFRDRLGSALTVAAPRSGQEVLSHVREATRDYLDTLGARISQGQDFSEGAASVSDGEVLLNRALADRLFGSTTAVGETVKMAGSSKVVVGVFENISHFGLERAPEPEIYLPIATIGDTAMVAVRAEAGRLPTWATFERALRRAVPEAATSEALRLSQVLSGSYRDRTLPVSLAGILAGFALLLCLTSVGISIAYEVLSREKELAIRQALGQTPGRVASACSLETARWIALGAVVGAGLTPWIQRLLSYLSFASVAGWKEPAAAAVLITGAAGAIAWLGAQSLLRRDLFATLRENA
jgi:putative ABC transport system permease protein